jgi:glycolate oxidase
VQHEIRQKLIDITGEDNFTDQLIDLVSYSYDACELCHRPDGAVWPNSTKQVSEILALANAEGLPVTPRGAGSGLAGAALAIRGGIIMDLSRMNQILDISLVDRQVRVQAGVVYQDLQKALAPHGFFYPPDPASGKVATLGGNLATNAGGLKGAKYGVTKHYVLGLEVVLADGSILKTGSNCLKCSSGYDMTGLFVGSEGTLGVITEITLKILPEPKEKATAMATFKTLAQAGEAIAAIMGAKAMPCVLEVMDENCIELLNKYSPVSLPRAEAMLLAETDGFTQGEADQQIELIVEIMRRHGAQQITKAESRVQAEELWTARRAIGGLMAAPKGASMAEDVTVPPSKVSQLLRGVHEIGKRHRISTATLGHVGDGNLHPNLLYDKNDPEECERMEAAAAELFKLAVDLGGTLTGEHGIGLVKAPFMTLEHDETAMGTMSLIKRALDPNNILNPGKMALATG